jgi:hypothetical protein
MASADSYCAHECGGFILPPHAGSLWPGESARDFGFPLGPHPNEIPESGEILDVTVYSARETDPHKHAMETHIENLYGKLDEAKKALEEEEEESAKLRDQLRVYEEAMKAAAGGLMVDIPEPGSLMGKMMSANVLLRWERDRYRDIVLGLRDDPAVEEQVQLIAQAGYKLPLDKP